MADYFPFDRGPGSNVTEAQWGLMAKNWLGTGVIKGAINEFQVYADSSGMQVKVKSGQSWIEGFFFQVVTETVVPISAANSSNPRIDRIAIQVDWTNNIISLIAIQGNPAASPTPPALTQGSAIWQISLAQVYVGANVSTIAVVNVTDERIYALTGDWLKSNVLSMQYLNQRFESIGGTFFTNGGSNSSTANMTFSKAFSSAPIIIPANMYAGSNISYSDVMYYPYIYNITTTGFSVKLSSAGNLGTIGSPANIGMNFLAIGS